jgi:hypothetical protein
VLDLLKVFLKKQGKRYFQSSFKNPLDECFSV